MWLAAYDALKVHILHQPGHGAAGDSDPLAPELPPHLADTVDLSVHFEHAADLGAQDGIPPDPRQPSARIGPLRKVIVAGGWGDRQHLANRLDPVLRTTSIDERHHRCDRRSSSAMAKYAVALRRISFAWRSSRFSRSNALAIVLGPMADKGSLLSAMSLEMPARCPLSSSAFLTQLFNVFAEQPIFAATEAIACRAIHADPDCRGLSGPHARGPQGRTCSLSCS